MPYSREGAKKPAGPLSYGRFAGSLLFTSGQGPIDTETGQMDLGTFERQAKLTLENVAAVAAAVGATLNDVVKVNIYLADLANMGQLNDVYRRFFAEPYPSRTAVQAYHGDIAMEIDAVASVPAQMEDTE